MKKLDTYKRRVAQIGSVVFFMNGAQAAIYWNSTADFASSGGVEGSAAFGNDFTTQTFTATGSHPGSSHTAAALTDIELNFNGLTVNGGGLETLKGRLDHSPSSGTDSRIGMQSTVAYVIGDVLEFSFSWKNQMVSDAGGKPFGGTAVDYYSGVTAPKVFGTDSWANLRHMFLFDDRLDFSSITFDLHGNRVGLATDDFRNGFVSTNPTPTTVNGVTNDNAQFTYTSLGDNRVMLNDVEDTAGSIDDFEVDRFTVTATLGRDLAVGSNFIFTFDGVSNGTEVVPEPSGAVLSLIGLSAMGMIRKRTK